MQRQGLKHALFYGHAPQPRQFRVQRLPGAAAYPHTREARASPPWLRGSGSGLFHVSQCGSTTGKTQARANSLIFLMIPCHGVLSPNAKTVSGAP